MLSVEAKLPPIAAPGSSARPTTMEMTLRATLVDMLAIVSPAVSRGLMASAKPRAPKASRMSPQKPAP